MILGSLFVELCSGSDRRFLLRATLRKIVRVRACDSICTTQKSFLERFAISTTRECRWKKLLLTHSHFFRRFISSISFSITLFITSSISFFMTTLITCSACKGQSKLFFIATPCATRIVFHPAFN